MKVFYERVRDLMSEKSTSNRELCRAIDITNDTIKNWETRNPGASNVVAVAKYFHVSTDYLLGMTDQRGAMPSSREVSLKVMDLLEFIESLELTDKQTEIVMCTVKGLLNFEDQQDQNSEIGCEK